MVGFKYFLESNIVFSSFWNDGTITVIVDDIKHTFLSDAALHPRWQQMAKRHPELVLKQIMDLVKKGFVQEIR